MNSVGVDLNTASRAAAAPCVGGVSAATAKAIVARREE